MKIGSNSVNNFNLLVCTILILFGIALSGGVSAFLSLSTPLYSRATKKEESELLWIFSSLSFGGLIGQVLNCGQSAYDSIFLPNSERIRRLSPIFRVMICLFFKSFFIFMLSLKWSILSFRSVVVLIFLYGVVNCIQSFNGNVVFESVCRSQSQKVRLFHIANCVYSCGGFVVPILFSFLKLKAIDTLSLVWCSMSILFFVVALAVLVSSSIISVSSLDRFQQPKSTRAKTDESSSSKTCKSTGEKTGNKKWWWLEIPMIGIVGIIRLLQTGFQYRSYVYVYCTENGVGNGSQLVLLLSFHSLSFFAGRLYNVLVSFVVNNEVVVLIYTLSANLVIFIVCIYVKLDVFSVFIASLAIAFHCSPASASSMNLLFKFGIEMSPPRFSGLFLISEMGFLLSFLVQNLWTKIEKAVFVFGAAINFISIVGLVAFLLAAILLNRIKSRKKTKTIKRIVRIDESIQQNNHQACFLDSQ